MSLEPSQPSTPAQAPVTATDSGANLIELQAPKIETEVASCATPTEKETLTAKRGFWGALRFVERGEFDGTERGLKALNDGLARAWNQSSPVGWILARVRCEILKMPPFEYADAHGLLSHSTLAGLETYRSLKRARFNPETIHLLLEGWERLAEKHKVENPRIADMLGEAKRELLLALTRKYGQSVYGVLARWRYEVGPERFDTLSGYSYKTMWQRQKAGVMFDFGDLLRIGRSLGFIEAHEKPPSLWQNPRVQELEAAWMFDSKQMGRPKEIAQLYRMVEACGLKVDKDSLHRDPKIKLQSVVVEALYRFERVSWKKIEPLFRELRACSYITEPEYRRIRARWVEHWKHQPESFERRLRSIRDERGLTNSQLAEALDLKRQEMNKPILPVFRALSYGEKNKHASYGVLAHLIGRSNEEVESLLAQKRSEILAQWRRQGSTITSPVAVERELWCLDYSDLPHTKSDIQRLEWGKRCSLEPERVVTEIREIGESRVKVALKRLLSQRDLDTVPSAISNLVALEGLAPLARRLETSVPVLKNIMSGAEVPTYPKLVSFMRLLGRQPSLALEVDWRDQFARHLIAENRNDLERVLDAYVAEHSDSRRSLLQEKGRRSSDVARFFDWISEAGVAEPANLTKVLECFDIDPSHPTRWFLESVAYEGTVAEGLSRWLQNMEQVEGYRDIRTKFDKALRAHQRSRNKGNSIEKLREQIVDFEISPASSSSSSAACEILRLVPGVTLAEIKEALTLPGAVEGSIGASLVQACRSNGLSTRDIAFALRDMVPSDRRPIGLLEVGIEVGIPSAACPPGVLAYLAVESAEHAERSIAALRSELSTRVEKFKFPGHDAVVEMMVWGIRRDDLGISPKDFAREMWGAVEAESDTPDEPNAVNAEDAVDKESSATQEKRPGARIKIQAQELGLEKVRKALREVIHRRTAVVPWQLVEIATQGMPGKDRAFSERGGFRLGAAAQFIAGSVMPTPKQLRRTVELAELTFSDEMEWGWSEAYARFLQKRETAPLGRALMCQIVSKEFDSSDTTDLVGGKTLIDNIVSRFLKRSGLSVRKYRLALHAACVDGVLEEEHIDALARALGYAPKSPAAALLQYLSGSHNAQSALFGWSEKFWNRKSAIDMFLEVGSFYAKEREQREARLSAGKLSVQDLIAESARLLHQPEGQASREFVAARKNFVGMTRDEILAAYIRAKAELVEEREVGKKQAPAAITPEVWVKPKELFTLPLDSRLDEIVHRLRDGKSVSIADTIELLPVFSPLISEIYQYLKTETPWFVAATAFYHQPDEALREIREQLRQGKEPRYPSRKFLETHSTWVRGRGDLGKLNSISMRLNFREPFVAPGSIKR